MKEWRLIGNRLDIYDIFKTVFNAHFAVSFYPSYKKFVIFLLNNSLKIGKNEDPFQLFLYYIIEIKNRNLN